MGRSDYGVGLAVFGAGALGLGALTLLGKKLGKKSLTSLPEEPGATDAASDDRSVAGVVLSRVAGDKAKVVKAVREITGLGWDEAEALVESAPVVVERDAGAERAVEVKKQLTGAGAKAEIMVCRMSQLRESIPWVKAVLIFILAGDVSHLEAARRKWIEWDSNLVKLGVSEEIMEELREFWTEMKGQKLVRDASAAAFTIEQILGKDHACLSRDSDEAERYCALELLLRLLPTAADYSNAQREIIDSLALSNGMDRETMLRVCREIWEGGTETPETVDQEVERLAQRWDALVGSLGGAS